MKLTWVRAGSPVPDGDKLRRLGITGLVYDATDPIVTAAFLDEVRNEWHFDPWLTWSADWDDVAAVELARRMSVAITARASNSKRLGMIADIEALWRRQSTYVITWLNEWRRLRPTRRTIFTTEPLQGGAISDELAARINADVNLLVVPQLYFDKMVPAVEAQVAMELIQTPGRRDIQRSRVKCYYDAHRLPSEWDGIAYDCAALP